MQQLLPFVGRNCSFGPVSDIFSLARMGVSLVIGIDCNICADNIRKTVSLTYEEAIAMGLQEETVNEIEKVRQANQQGWMSGLAQGLKSTGEILASSTQAVLGTPQENQRLLGLGMAKHFLKGTWLFKPLWDLFVFGIPSLSK